MLSVDNLSVCYGPVTALHGIHLVVQPREIIALLGANGAGKTSLLRAISGLVPASGGGITFESQSIRGLPAHQIVAAGLAHCPEGRRIFPEMTLHENLLIGAYGLASPVERKQRYEQALHYFPELADRLKQKAGTLSGGEQQMLAVARSLMSAPRLLMLDEPSLGLAPLLIARLFGIIETINREAGVAILLVEQNAREALTCAQRVYVLENGRITLSGTSSDLQRDPRVVEAYLGGSLQT